VVAATHQKATPMRVTMSWSYDQGRVDLLRGYDQGRVDVLLAKRQPNYNAVI